MSPPCPDDTPVPKSCRSNGKDGRPPRSQHRRAGAVFAVLALAIVSCSGGAEPEAGPEPPTTPPADPASEPSPATTGPAAAPEPDDASPEPAQPEETSPPAEPEEPEEPAPEFPPPPNPPPVNPFLADSAVPMPHGDAGQTDWSSVAGPAGPADSGNSVELTYRHLGPGHFGIAISSPYPDGRRVIWSNGGDRISKLDHDTLEVLAELPLTDGPLMTAAEAEAEIAVLDELTGADLVDAGLGMAVRYLIGLAGIYYVLDADNTLFVGGADSIVAYADADRADPESPVEVAGEWRKPEGIGGDFVGANVTFDGRLAMVTNQGWLVLVERDFSAHYAVRLNGAEGAADHNRAMLDAGFRPGAADWVRNSLAVDSDGGIYAVSAGHIHKVVWDGEALSTDEADGAWTEPYLSRLDAGSGATPSLMGFGAEDRFVVITDGEPVMNVVLFWRDEIPDGWEQLPGAPSRRIAGQLPALIGDPDRASIQTEQSVVTAGYGALVVNNDPASAPEGWSAVGNRVLVSYAGADPAFSPKGVQKFEWDPESRTFGEAWANTEVGSANAVPIVSADLRHVYTVGARRGQWTLEAIDFQSGESAFHWVTGSNRYNTLFSGMNLDQQGRIVHTTVFGIVRYDPTGS